MNENLKPLCKCEMAKILYWKAVKPFEGSGPNCLYHSINAVDMLMFALLLSSKRLLGEQN